MTRHLVNDSGDGSHTITLCGQIVRPVPVAVTTDILQVTCAPCLRECDRVFAAMEAMLDRRAASGIRP
jgi:hypothetical protein